ncbi:hypothetical protein KIN20_024309 [Parelaphostrongylus tenuis]|uniref:Uncharacterized protein n=1 Tax=Parelaphostrongylus tenuis TaxID=148309 RepID=A0AAD5QTJ7_PARTN|nr:hypothetical protein KIN20_024309 [Parelaphostrongylus tenuis]
MGEVNLEASGGVVLWEDWCAAWTGVSQSMGRRRQESSAFNWSVRPPGYVSSSYLFPSPFSIPIAYNYCL